MSPRNQARLASPLSPITRAQVRMACGRPESDSDGVMPVNVPR